MKVHAADDYDDHTMEVHAADDDDDNKSSANAARTAVALLPAELTRSEVMSIVKGVFLEDRDSDAGVTFSDRAAFYMENVLAVNASMQFYLLGTFTAALGVTLGVLWTKVLPCDDADEDCSYSGTTALNDAVYTSFEVIIAGGYNTDIHDAAPRLVFIVQMFSGLVIFGIFVGFIADAVTSFMDSLSQGRTKVAETGHTLILGWDESTPRLVKQIAFLRRAWQQQNETFAR